MISLPLSLSVCVSLSRIGVVGVCVRARACVCGMRVWYVGCIFRRRTASPFPRPSLFGYRRRQLGSCLLGREQFLAGFRRRISQLPAQMTTVSSVHTYMLSQSVW